MNHPRLLSIAALAVLAATGCNKSNPDVAKKLAELESQNKAALERQQALERQLAEQQLTAERDAIERERQRIEDDRLALEQDQSDAAAAKQAALAEREQALALREGKLEGLETSVEEKQRDLNHRDNLISGRELELAGREPLPRAEPAPAPALPVGDYSMFYDSLAAYGSWFQAPSYGYVWQPAIVRSPGWRPYCDGRWVCSDGGWTWLSNEPFGWATYHYGRWAQLRSRGWVWVPGDQWAPAWVCWRENGSHIGWAPLPPETLAYRDCHWDNTVETRFGISAGWFNFVAVSHFSRPIRSHCLPLAQNGDYYRHTLNITNLTCRSNRVFVGGPDYQGLCRTGGRTIPYYQLNLDRQQRPGRDLMAMRPRMNDNQLRMPAPEIATGWNASVRPTRVREQLKEVAIDRPAPLAPEVANEFRRHREHEQAQADQEVARLGGREAFNRRRTQQLEANQREAAALARQAPASENPTAPAAPARPQRPDRPADPIQPGPIAGQPAEPPAPPVTTPGETPTRPQRPGRPDRPADPVQPQPGPIAGQPAEPPAPPVATPGETPTRPQRPSRPDRPVETAPVAEQPSTPVNPNAAQTEAQGQQATAAAQQTARQAQQDEARQQQQEAAKQAAEATAQQEAAGQQQAEALKQQAEAQRQQAAEAAKQQAEAQRQQAAEAARAAQQEARAAQQEEARQQQAEAAKQQAEAQRQQAAEAARAAQQEARAAQQEEARQQEAHRAQQEEARQRQQQEQQQRQAEEARQRQQQEQQQRQAEEARQRQQQEQQQRQAEEARQQQEQQQRGQ